MNNILILKKWLEMVADRKKWAPYNEWTNQEFQELSEEISEKSEILLNRNTIRKLVDHLKNGKEYFPRIATRNAFAVYIGYENWKHFQQDNQPQNTITVKRNYWIWGTALLAIIVGVIIIVLQKKYQHDYQFKITNSEGTVPHTINCEYNFKKIKTDDILLDLGHIDPYGKYLLLPLKKNASIFKQCFHYPGKYDIRLFIDKQLCKQEDVWINSEGWFTYVVDINPYFAAHNLPSWFRGYGLPRIHHLSFDAILTPDTTQEGLLHIPKIKIDSLQHISANYQTHFKNYRDFGLSLNQCDFSIGFKDPDFGKGTNCYEVVLQLEGDKGEIRLKFVEKGCESYTHQKVGSQYIDGKNENLDYLTIDYKDLTTVRIKNSENKITIEVDDLLRKTIPLKEDLGKLRGLHFWFKGSPYIDYVELKDMDGKIAFADYFDTVGK